MEPAEVETINDDNDMSQVDESDICTVDELMNFLNYDETIKLIDCTKQNVDIEDEKDLILPNSSLNIGECQDINSMPEDKEMLIPLNLNVSSPDAEPLSRKSTRSKTNKRSSPNQKWSREQTKLKRLNGEPYKGYRRKFKGKTNIILHDSNKSARVMGPRCRGNCSKWSTRKCTEITETTRTSLFSGFWKDLDWSEKKLYISTLVKDCVPKQPLKVTKSQTNRTTTYMYHLKDDSGNKIPVCQTMFLNTFGLKNSTLRHWLKNFSTICGSTDKKLNTENRAIEV